MKSTKTDITNTDDHFNLFEQLVAANNRLKEEVLIRKNSEINLIHNEEKYRSLISNMELGLVEVDNNDKITDINDRMVEMSGYTTSELKGKKYIDIFLDSTSKKVMEAENERRKMGNGFG